MNFYLIPPTQPFLDNLADFIIDNFSQNMDRLKVVLPTGYSCFCLQNLLIEKKKHCLLPTVIPFSDLTAESEEIFKIPSANLGTFSPLEEKIILAEIIHRYKPLNFTINQALKFSSKLAKLFYDLAISNVDIRELQNIPVINQAEHWQSILDFLISAHEQWQKKIIEKGRVDRASYQSNMLKAELIRLKNQKAQLIIAGIYGHNAASLDFLEEVALLPSCHIVENFDREVFFIKDSSLSSPTEGLYLPLNLIRALEIDYNTVRFINEKHTSTSYLFKFLEPNLALEAPPPKSIDYLEFTDIFSEADYISTCCSQYIKQYPENKIAIVLSSEKNKDLYQNFLLKRQLKYSNLLGTPLAQTPAAKLIIDVARMICCDFDLKNLFILLKNPLLISEKINSLESVFIGKNRFTSSWHEFLKIIELTKAGDIKALGITLSQTLNVEMPLAFQDILVKVITISEALCENVWSSNYAFESSSFFAEVLELKWDLKLNSLSIFPDILQTMMTSARCFNNETSSNIVVCNLADAALLKFDLIIIPDCSEANLPPATYQNPWLSNQLQEELNLTSDRIGIGQNCYQFYLLLNNKKVIITRAKKQESKAESLPSSYVLRLEMILPKRHYEGAIATTAIQEATKSRYNYTSMPDYHTPRNGDYTIKPKLPSIISATDVETLIRCPYSFYAKKILHLRKTDSISTPIKLSEFGSYVHDCFEKYTIAYDSIAGDKIEYLSMLSGSALNEMILPASTKKIWSIKFANIAKAFVDWDEERRQSNIGVFTEIKGSLDLKINEREIKLIAIADRIEVDGSGVVSILDYKTGAVPTKKDVMAGLAPQLVLEAMIVSAGGFNIKASEIGKLVYVKIASSKPYIQTTEIEISPAEIQEHKASLIKLLEFYDKEKNYFQDLDLLKYNDYKHLARTV